MFDSLFDPDPSTAFCNELISKRCIASVEIERFYASQHQTEKPIIVLRDDRVLDLDQRGQLCKIEIGMTARAAKNILAEGDFVDWKPEHYMALQFKWLDVCTRFTDSIEPIDQHAAFLDLSLHPDPVGISDELILALHRELNLIARLGMARSKWVAPLVGLNARNTFQADSAEFVGALPIAYLAPVPAAERARLKFLGYSRIRDVARIPFEELFEQFGELAYTIRGAALGVDHEPVKAIYPPNSFADRILFQEPIDSSETILAICKRWAGRIGSELSTKSVEGTKAKLTLEDETGRLREVQRTFVKPIRCSRTAYSALILMLDGLLDRPIQSLRILISELRKVSAYQTDFVFQSRNQNRIVNSLRHVRDVFGDRSVQLGNEIEEPRRVKVLREWKHATGWQ